MVERGSIRIVVLSTDPDLQSLASKLTANYSDILLTATASAWSELVTNPGLPSSIMLLDAELAGPIGAMELIHEARTLGTRVITLSRSDAPGLVMKAMAAGADAALQKSDSSRRVADQLRLAANRDHLIRQRGK